METKRPRRPQSTSKQVSSPVLDSVIGLVTFGDPNGDWHNTPLPTSIPSTNSNSSCITSAIFDPLCAVLPADFEFPTPESGIIDPCVESIPTLAMDTQQIEAAVKLIVDVPAQLAKGREAFVAQLEEPEQVVRLLLTLQHFLYGDNGMAAEAAEWVYWKTECRGC